MKVFDKDGDLIAESDETVYEEIAPGQIQENVIRSNQLEHDWVQNPDNKIAVVFRYGYVD